jgi:hypothetical protein
MAQKVTVAPADDLDGRPADATARFGFEGADYAIDLRDTNAGAFRKQLTPFIQHASNAGQELARRCARTAANRQRGSDIRSWAKDHGIGVSERRRIPASVLEQQQAPAKRRRLQTGRRSAPL